MPTNDFSFSLIIDTSLIWHCETYAGVFPSLLQWKHNILISPVLTSVLKGIRVALGPWHGGKGGKLKCQTRGVAVHRISKERQGWRGEGRRGGTRHTEWERRRRRGARWELNNERHKPWSTFLWGDSRPPQHPFENSKNNNNKKKGAKGCSERMRREISYWQERHRGL